jgi:hypothetical protein
MSVKSFISIISLVLLCTATVSAYTMQDAVGEYYIPIGVPVIDGVISPGEWDKANWLDLDKVYYGDPLDLSNAKWAAMWSPETNLIYVVVTVTDTVHIFGDYYGELAWNKYDLMEVYIDIGNNDPETYYFEGDLVREPAHQWMCGNDNNGGSWVVLPEENLHPENPLPEEIRPLLVTSINGNVLTYELAIPPYEWIGWLTDETMNLRQLETDMRIGLDVIMSSKSSTKFGMLCENVWTANDDIDGDGSADGVDTTAKWKFAERYLDHFLVADPICTPVEVYIKPGSCPNPLNVKSKGVLPVAILGSEDFDVGMIDVASIRLADVAPIRSDYEDVAAPVIDGDECKCTEEGPDDYLDLTLKFDTQGIVEALGEVVNGEEWVLTLTGVLSDGTSIEGEDCIRVKKPRAKRAKKVK